MISFNFNGTDSSSFPWLVVNKVDSPLMAPLENQLITVPGKPGAYHAGQTVGVRQEQIRITVFGDSQEDLAAKKRILADWLVTDRPVPFFYSYEPDKTYKAVLSGSTDLDKIVVDGETTLTFIIPDPHAVGPSQSQIVTTREVSEDTRTQADWAQGTLSDVVATSEGLQLAKEGEDLSGSADWTLGEHEQTRVNGNGKLALDYLVHEPTTANHSEAAESWTGGQNDGVAVDGESLVINTFPAWTFTDNMTNFISTGWDPRINPGQVIQTGQTAELVSTIGEGTAVALVRETTDTIRSYEFLYRLALRSQHDQNIAPGGKLVLSLNTRWPTDSQRWVSFHPRFRPTYGPYAWMRIVVTRLPTTTDNGNADVYINGQYVESIEGLPTQLTPRIQIIMENGDQGVLNIADVKYIDTVLHQKQSSYLLPLIGQRVSPEYDLSGLGEYQGSTVTHNWSRNYSLPLHGEEWNHIVDLEVDVFKNGAWTGYQEISSGDPIPQLNEGEDLRDVKVRIRSTLKSFDYYKSPLLHDVMITVDGFLSEYHLSGTWISPAITLGQMGIAKLAQLDYEMETQPGTSIVAEVAIEESGVIGEWQEIESGNLPQLIGVDLTNIRLFYRFRLATTDPAITPRVVGADYLFESAYKPEGYRISAGVPFGDMKIADESFIRWATIPEGSSDVGIDVQLVQSGEQPQPGQWTPIADNGGPIPGMAGKEITGLVLFTRQRLASDGFMTPQLLRLEWMVTEEGETELDYKGTAPGYPLLRMEVMEETDHIRILHLESGLFILIENEENKFKPGDVIEVDHSAESVKLNGIYRMKYLNIRSRFFKLEKGINTFEVSPMGAAQVEVSWEERWK